MPTATLPTTTGATKSLQLLRSYEIPRDDPAYDRLLNWSWSYDSAVAAAAFAAEGDREQAARLLDQLGALQHPDGSIETAFEVRTGEAVPSVRSGTVAWVGLAAATYDEAFDTDRYRAMAERAAGFLLALRGRDGLIAGGADVAWVSTQHNLVAYALLDRLADELPREDRKSAKEDRKRATEYRKAASEIGTAIEKQLLVSSAREAWFRQGLGDDVRALDTQAIGSMFLRARRRADVGKLVLEGVQKSFALTGRSIARSADLTAFNATYAAVGPFVGYRPFVGTGAPDVLWFEGTAEMRLAKSAFDQDTRDLDASIGRWAAITAKGGSAPLGADRTVTGNEYGEFHVWPTGAAAAWSLLSTETPTFFIEPRSDDDHGEDDDD